MSMTDAEKRLGEALAIAKQAAEAAAPGDDGGSANLDCCLLSGGLRSETVRTAAEAAGVTVSHCNTRPWRGWFVHVGRGQGAMNTRMAEAAAKALTDCGYEATVYYQVD